MTTSRKKQALIIFFEDRNRDKVKDVLTNSLSEDQKTELYRAFLTDTISNCLGLVDVDIRISYLPGPMADIVKDTVNALTKSTTGKAQKMLKSDNFKLVESEGKDVGERISKASEKLFAAGYDRVVMIGCVTPTLPRKTIQTAFKRAEKYDLVIGPTLEGSYYLFGLHQPRPDLFAKIDWSDDTTVYSQITSVCEQDGIEWNELDLWYDLRQPGDIEFLVRDINHYRIVGDETSAVRTEQVLEEILKDLPS